MKVCMIAYTFYESDNRVIRYAETLAKQGDHVDVISLRIEKQSSFDTLNGVRIYRIQKRFNEKQGEIFYLLRLIKFLIISSIFFTIKHLKNRYDIIHVHSVPDFEVFAAWMGKLTRAKIILDIHDIVPELYASKFNVNNQTFIFKLLVFIEKVSIAFSNHVIISNHLWEKTLVMRSVRQNKCTVIMNYPDPSIFYKRPRRRKDNKFIICYPGTVNKHQGLDVAIKAFSIIKDKIPMAEFHIYGRGPEEKFIKNFIVALGLNNKVFLKRFLPIKQIVKVMANADLGIVPKRKDSFGNEAFSTKILEFMALGIPTIISDTKIDQFYFNENVVKYFKSGDEEDLARCILLLYNDQKLRKRLIKNGMDWIKENNWDVKKVEYIKLLNTLSK